MGVIDKKPKNRICAGLLAHVDAGKTTLSEGLLYYSGITRSMGRVDHGDAFLDTYKLEKDRGITIFSKQAIFALGEEKEVILLDTPGHMDFSAETERTLQILDYAILVISGSDGVQGQVHTLWTLLEKYQIPTFVFINKIDLNGFSREKTLQALNRELGEGFIPFDLPKEDIFELAAVCEEKALETYLHSGTLSDKDLSDLIGQRKVFPCFFGSALKMEGIDVFLDGLNRYTVCPTYDESCFSARVYKISRDEQGNRLTHMKILGGSLQVKDAFGREKVNQIRMYNGRKFETASCAFPGTVCAVTGLTETFSGQGLGAAASGGKPYLDTVLTYQVYLPKDWEAKDAYEKLSQIEEEIPELHLAWDKENSAIRLMIMGEIQGEILLNLVKERFQKEITLGEPEVSYRETILTQVEGVGHFEPLRHYAEVHLLLEPLPSGSGLIFDTSCSEDSLDRNWQRLVLTHLQETSFPGVLTGAPITDMKITLAAGKAHVKHTEGGDFRQATYRAVRHGLAKAKSQLLEPYYGFRLELPEDMVGRAMTDLQNMQGTCEGPQISAGRAVLTGTAPVSAMNGYQKEVTGYTKGRGRLFCTLSGYFPCHNEEEVIGKIGYDFERDTVYPADSVFCAHGAGVIVPWTDVENHMDLPACLTEKKSVPILRPRGEVSYSDGELEAIFRATYGISKREQNRFNRESRVVSAGRDDSRYKGTNSAYNNSSAEELLLIDGYNMIFAWDELKDMSSVSLESARTLLIEILQNYQGYTGTKMLLVFDAYKQPGNVGSKEVYGDLQVVYTKEGQTADQFIEKFVLENVKKMRITVATSDGLEQIMVFGQGALRMPARELKERIEAANSAMRTEYLGK